MSPWAHQKSADGTAGRRIREHLTPDPHLHQKTVNVSEHAAIVAGTSVNVIGRVSPAGVLKPDRTLMCLNMEPQFDDLAKGTSRHFRGTA
jgi:hypothetical protein